MASYLNRKDLPRGIRNNNPGNLVITDIGWKNKVPKSQNTDGHFEQFTSIEYGVRAMFIDLIHDIANKGLNTPSKLINAYAPASDGNNISAYINYLSNMTGVGSNEAFKLTEHNIKIIGTAIMDIENGNSPYITPQLVDEGFALINNSARSYLTGSKASPNVNPLNPIIEASRRTKVRKGVGLLLLFALIKTIA